MELPGKKGHLSYTGKEGSRERRRGSGTQSTESGEQRHLTRTLKEADCVGLDLHQHFSHSVKPVGDSTLMSSACVQEVSSSAARGLQGKSRMPWGTLGLGGAHAIAKRET